MKFITNGQWLALSCPSFETSNKDSEIRDSESFWVDEHLELLGRGAPLSLPCPVFSLAFGCSQEQSVCLSSVSHSGKFLKPRSWGQGHQNPQFISGQDAWTWSWRLKWGRLVGLSPEPVGFVWWKPRAYPEIRRTAWHGGGQGAGEKAEGKTAFIFFSC